jgi:hypothetical protein
VARGTAPVPGTACPQAAACRAGPEFGIAAAAAAPGGDAAPPLVACGCGAATVTIAGVVVGLLAMAGMAVLCHARVRRLHRLHIRVDAARAGLDAALARRAAAASTASAVVPAAPPSWPPQERSDISTPGPRAVVDPEAAANALGRALACLDRTALPADVRAALADAEQLLVLARRVHNDAVRDTLGLRSRRLVRWLRLAGSAPMPAYFEIADPPPTLPYHRVSPSQE